MWTRSIGAIAVVAPSVLDVQIGKDLIFTTIGFVISNIRLGLQPVVLMMALHFTATTWKRF